jgi:WD40 repeat protein
LPDTNLFVGESLHKIALPKDAQCVFGYQDLLFVSSREWDLRVFNRQYQCIATLPTNHAVQSITTFHNHVVAGLFGGKLQVFEMHSWKPVTCRTNQHHTESVNCFFVWNGLLLSGSADNSVRIWNANYECVKVLTHNGSVTCIANWKHVIFTGAWDDTVKAWDTTTWSCIETVPTQNHVIGLEVIGDTLIIGINSCIQFLDCHTMKTQRRLDMKDAIRRIAISPRADLLFTLKYGEISVFNLKDISFVTKWKAIDTKSGVDFLTIFQGNLVVANSDKQEAVVWKGKSASLIRCASDTLLQ